MAKNNIFQRNGNKNRISYVRKTNAQNKFHCFDYVISCLRTIQTFSCDPLLYSLTRQLACFHLEEYG